MQIRPYNLLPPTERYIKPWERQFISTDGPNTIDQLFLDDIAIGYSDFYVSRQVLGALKEDIPLYFDGLEQELIFLLVRVRIDKEYDPDYPYDITKNITYYFSGATDDVQPINTFFIQTGSYNNKVSQIYFNNPNEFDVVLDIFGAVLEKTTTTTISTGVTTCNNLWLESMMSDIVVGTGITYNSLEPVDYFLSGSTLPLTTSTQIDGNTLQVNNRIAYLGGIAEVSSIVFSDIIWSIGFPVSDYDSVYVNSGDTYSGTSWYWYNSTWNYLLNSDIISGSTALKVVLFNIDGYVYDYIDDYFDDLVCSTIPYTGITNIVKNIDDLSIIITGQTQVYILKFLTEFDLHQGYSRIKWVMSNPDIRFLDYNYVYENNSGITGMDLQKPVIYYYPSGTTVPTGSTLGVLTKNQILEHFISGVTDYWDGRLPITGATSKLNKIGSPVSLTGTTDEAIYEISFTYTDNANNSTGATIGNIYVDATPPTISYKYGIVNSGTTGSTLTGNTIDYSGATITEIVDISSGFTMVASGRTPTGITNADIRDYIIDSVSDNVDTTISKYDIDFYIVDNRRTLLTAIPDPYYTKTYNSLTIPSLSGVGQTLVFTGGTNLYWSSGDEVNLRYNSTHNFNVIVSNYDYTTGIFITTITSGITGSGSTYSNWIVDEPSGNKSLDFCIKLTLSDFCSNTTTDYLILRTKS